MATAAGSSAGPQPHAPAPSAASPSPVPASRSTPLREAPRPSSLVIRPPLSLTWSVSLFDGGSLATGPGRTRFRDGTGTGP
ncbi:hypothetical protein GCM10017667_61060 [Streptomyces filamentosus]|uniref:Uncharacterized protein n=1 Tax=Streptomyces filamentosus TaxID=67294 RepID=A0A919EQW3_STRFL|nr:hypothetical protein GCM10017667_61060 [Streptomyces filamentosus]